MSNKIGVAIKIDVSKIDKTKLFKGAKGTYLDATVFIDPDSQSQYGDNGIINQSVSKEEKAAGQQGALLGNVKVFWRDGGQQVQQASQQQPSQSQGFNDSFDDTIPF